MPDYNGGPPKFGHDLNGPSWATLCQVVARPIAWSLSRLPARIAPASVAWWADRKSVRVTMMGIITGYPPKSATGFAKRGAKHTGHAPRLGDELPCKA